MSVNVDVFRKFLLEHLITANENQGAPSKPVVMLNLLKFKEGDGESGYTTYSQHVLPLLHKVGGKVLFQGKPAELLIGKNQDWDLLILVFYPSRTAFLQMTTSKEYFAIQHYRDNSLSNSVLLALDPIFSKL